MDLAWTVITDTRYLIGLFSGFVVATLCYIIFGFLFKNDPVNEIEKAKKELNEVNRQFNSIKDSTMGSLAQIRQQALSNSREYTELIDRINDLERANHQLYQTKKTLQRKLDRARHGGKEEEACF